MGSQPPTTVLQHISWSYANLARAHIALREGRRRYLKTDHMVRAKLYKGLCDGTMQFGSLYDDERLKLLATPGCAYCDSIEFLTIDHLIPRARGGQHDGVNLVTACRSCNSSKRDSDMLEWCNRQGTFPRLMLLRRYIKIAFNLCEDRGLLDEESESQRVADLPLNPFALPIKYPALETLQL